MRYALAVLGALVAVACGSTSNDPTGSGGAAGAGGQSDAAPHDAGDDAPVVDAKLDTDDSATCTLPPDTTGNAQMIAEAACNPHTDCCTQAGLGFDSALCVSKLRGLLQSALDAARCRGATYDPIGVADCIATTKAYSATCPMQYGGKEYDASKQACARVLTGTQQPGAACGSNFECAQVPGAMTTCMFHDGTSECIRTVYGQAGASCDPTSSPVENDCDEYAGLICEGSKCVPLAGVGEACYSDWDCMKSASCETKLCQPRAKLGEACDDNCETGLACVSGKCGGILGDSCTAPGDCGSYQCVSGKCAPNNNLVGNLLMGLNCQ